MPRPPVFSLSDKYLLNKGRIFLTGTQALVRMLLTQRRRDLDQGINTAGFISGYRGSPLGNFDAALWQVGDHLKSHSIHFRPAVNEELAATSCWGSQQASIISGAKYDGVFAVWYGKGPGVDRSGDALKHGNLAGTSPKGGVLVLAGDDHGAKSSTTAHQSEQALLAAMIPVFNPASVRDYLELAPYAFALSRYSGLWIGYKCLTETVESAATVDVDEAAVSITEPDVDRPEAGWHIRFAFRPLAEEQSLIRYRLPAAQAFVRANRLDRTVIGGARRDLGIVTTGKATLDVLQALRLLGIDNERAQSLGLSVYKVTMSWPLEPDGILEFINGQRELLIVEEKRAFIEDQIARIMMRMPKDRMPALVGKYDELGAPLLPSDGDLSPLTIALVLSNRLQSLGLMDGRLKERTQHLASELAETQVISSAKIFRVPAFCSGCPHNRSTKLPQGSLGFAGIGCHGMVLLMPDRPTLPTTQMGGEGANWIGIAPFTEVPHVFQNLGDGTYFHSGLMAIRAAVAAGVNITYKILYNDAVAMTGGQPVDGPLSVADITAQLHAEHVKRVAIVTDEPENYASRGSLPPMVSVHHRDTLDKLQDELRLTPGVTAIIYDQTCAAEKRRRRKRGTYPDPDIRTFINHLVCEGCGDCSKKSNCVSIEPLETEFGRKREINQSSCNKDFSCVDGFCPSFVTVEGGNLKPKVSTLQPSQADLDSLSLPETPSLTETYGVLVTGIGGTGVVTVGAIIGMAAHLEGKACTTMDLTGLSQKNGAVFSHVKLAPKPEDLTSPRIGTGEANVLLGCDLIVSASSESLRTTVHGKSSAVVNTRITPTAAFAHAPNIDLSGDQFTKPIEEAVGLDRVRLLNSTSLAEATTGNSATANILLLGYAFQCGLLPLSLGAIIHAIELNGVAVAQNIAAFNFGRIAAVDPSTKNLPLDNQPDTGHQDLTAIVEPRKLFLAAYQDSAYAAQYTQLVEKVRRAEQEAVPGRQELSCIVARYLFKLMAYKDEYEVARLYTDTDFFSRIRNQIDGDAKVYFHFAPPFLSRKDPTTGEPRKRRFGPWVVPLLKLLSKFRRLRGTPMDILGYTRERKMERYLIADYETTVEYLLSRLNADNHALAVQIACLPEQIRGFGHIKQASINAAQSRKMELIAKLSDEAELEEAAETIA